MSILNIKATQFILIGQLKYNCAFSCFSDRFVDVLKLLHIVSTKKKKPSSVCLISVKVLCLGFIGVDVFFFLLHCLHIQYIKVNLIKQKLKIPDFS